MNKKKNILFLIIISLIIFMIIIFIHNNVFATNELINGMNPNNGSNATIDAKGDQSRLIKIVSRIFSIIQYAGTGLSIIAVMKLGISYMFSSIEEKAEIKKRATPILIGSFIIVATVNILKIIQKVVANSL